MSESLIAAARRLRDRVDELTFAAPVSHAYNPLGYAWRAHELYLRRYGKAPKRVLFLGMNPGPFGMAQTGVPFGQVAAVRDWLGIETEIDRPPNEHPKRPVTGFECHRSEISGERLWGLFAKRFGTAPKFFREHFVVNYCPLAFLEESGRNRTPDKLPPTERAALFSVCDKHLTEVVDILKPQWLMGIGVFAMKRGVGVFGNDNLPARSQPPRGEVGLGRTLHPSPACPASNNDWAGQVTAQLRDLGVW